MSKSSVNIKFNNKALQSTLNKAISKTDFKMPCPNCQNTLFIKGTQFGTNVICPNCGKSIALNNDQLNSDIKKIKL